MESNGASVLTAVARLALRSGSEKLLTQLAEGIMEYGATAKKAKIDGMAKVGAAALTGQAKKAVEIGEAVAEMSVEELLKLTGGDDGEPVEG